MPHDEPQHICEERIFSQLFEQLSKPLFRFLYFKSGDASLSEDLTQEAFLRLWNACKKVLPSKARAFLYRVGNNLFLDEVKHRKVVARFEFQAPNTLNAETPLEVLEQAEFKQRLEAAIAALPEKQRTVFLLNRIDKLRYKEIAELLGISVKAVEKRMHLALVELRRLSTKI